MRARARALARAAGLGVVRVVARLRALVRAWLARRGAPRALSSESGEAAPLAGPSPTARSGEPAWGRLAAVLARLARDAGARASRGLAWLAPRLEPAFARVIEVALARTPSPRVGKLVLVGALALAGGARGACAALPAPSEARVASQLGEAVGGRVEPHDFVWEPRGTALEDLTLGRGVVFLASRAGGPRDLYRARVRVTSGGHTLSVTGAHALSATPLADERDLVARGRFAAVRSVYGEVSTGLLVVDLEGARGASLGSRVALALARFFDGGVTQSATLVDVAFPYPPRELRFELDEAPSEGVLLVSTSEGDDVTRVPIAGATLAIVDRLRVAVRPPLAQPAPPGLVARLLGRVPSAYTPARRAPEADVPMPTVGDPSLGPALPAPAHGAAWPPRPAQGVAWHGALEGEAEPLVARARVAEGDAAVELFAFDTRRLDVDAVGGVYHPRSPLGPPRGGVLSPEQRARLVAMIALPDELPLGGALERQLVSPFVPSGPVLFDADDGAVHVALGPPRGATRFALSSTPARAPERRLARSLVCRTVDGQLGLAFSARATASALERAASRGGCERMVWLGESPEPLGASSLDASGRLTPMHPAMTWVDPLLGDSGRLDRGALLVLRRAPEAPDAGWAPDGGLQPHPASMPSVTRLQAEHLGVRVQVTRFPPVRARVSLSVGTREPGARALGVAALEPEAGRALASLALGLPKRKGGRGLMVAGQVLSRLRSEGLVAGLPGGRLGVYRAAGELPADASFVVELPLLADGGKLVPEGRRVGAMRDRAALCVRDDGWLLVATTTFDTDEAPAEALLAQGCARVVGFDRGGREPIGFRRFGADDAPRGLEASIATSLVVHEAPLPGRVQTGGW